jgi:hypothetical protein
MRRRLILALLGVVVLFMWEDCFGGPATGSELVPPPSVDGGKFEVTCTYAKSAQVDPIVSPGAPVSAHLHDFFGNTSIDENSTGASLVGGPTTCKLSKDSAGYWVPAAYRSDSGKRVLPAKVWAYYFGTPGVTEAHIPAGLEMLAGNHDATQPSEAEHVSFSCGNGHGITHSPTMGHPYNCKRNPDVENSLGVVAVVKFPYCWDGTGTAPSDVTFPDPAGDGSCPVFTLPQLQIHEHFGANRQHPGFQRGDLLTFSSGPWFTLHGDFMNGWAQRKLDALVDGCQNAPNVNCGFLSDANPGPSPSMSTRAAPAPPVAAAAEQIGAKPVCNRDVTTHSRKVHYHPLRDVNAVGFKWCTEKVGGVAKVWSVPKWTRNTLRTTNGKDLDCDLVAGVWVKTYFHDKLGHHGYRKNHVECAAGSKSATHRVKVTSPKRYYLAKHHWPSATGMAQVAYYGDPASFVWVRGHMNPFELGGRLPLVVRMLVASSARDAVLAGV